MPTFLEMTVDKFNFRVATDRRYTREGLWLLEVGPGRLRIGLTDFLQQRSGDAAFVKVRPAGTVLRAGEDLADMETIKVNQVLASPVSGTLVAVNPELELSPELVNQSPYDQGWLVEVETTSWDADRAALLAPEAYFTVMKGQAEQEIAS